VFERVIQEVCDASQVDFEESGVDQQTLADLRNVSDFFILSLL
jgi:transcription initiation factor TFIIA large subunit